MGKSTVIALVLAVGVTCLGCAAASTGDPDAVRGTEARVSGVLVTTTGGEVEYWAQWGTTPAYGSETTHQTEPVAQNEQERVYLTIPGLQRATTYHYRVCARDSQQQGGPGCGEDKTFTTPNLDCGDVITQDVTLSGELTCNPYSFAASGLVIGADGIDVNLGGNILRGPVVGFFDTIGPVAIDNTAGHDDVTIRNGAIENWGTVVRLQDADYNVIRNITAGRSGERGIEIVGGEGTVIRSTSLGPGGRFSTRLVADTDGLVVADSSGYGWFVDGSDARLVRNRIGGSNPLGPCLSVQGSRHRIADNQIEGCPFGGLLLGNGADNELVGNEVSEAEVVAFEGQPDGIRVEADSTNALLQGNYVHDNADDGIDVRAPGTRLQDNRAENNGDFGIDAVAGVIDLGGNLASGNGNPLQCRNVFCQ